MCNVPAGPDDALLCHSYDFTSEEKASRSLTLYSYSVHISLYTVLMNTLYNLQNQPLARLSGNQVINLAGQVLAVRENNHLEREGTVLVRWSGTEIQTRDGVPFGQVSGLEVRNPSGQTLATISDDCTEPVVLGAALIFFFAGAS